MTLKVNETVDSAVLAHESGRLDEADRLLRQALNADPENVLALQHLGVVAVKREDPATAVPALMRVLNVAPESFEAPFWLSIIMRKHGRFQEAAGMAERALSQRPDDVDALNQLGICYLDLKQFDQAAECFQRACSLAPEVGTLFENLGRALQGMGRLTEAIEALRKGVDLGPVRAASLFRLGDAYMQVPNVDAAAECARAVLQINPNSVPGTLLLARSLIGSGQVEEGAKVAKKVMGMSPGNPIPIAYYGRALQSLGRIEEADEQFRHSIELQPKQGFAYYSLVQNHKVKEEERPMVAKMLELSVDRELPLRETIQLQYGLGKALEDLGDYQVAMAHLDEANRIDTQLKVGVAPYRKKDLEETADFLIKAFNPQFFEEAKSLGRDEDTAIFVVGMMRSGTTLAEQILSSHPKVGGAGELLFWPDHAGSSHKLFSFGEEGVGFDGDRLQSLSSDYLELLSNISPGKARVVDKMNTNYLLVGLLHIAFPNARFIHMKRHPVDTCLSIWATPVANGINLCASKDNVVSAYEQYVRVMQHWAETIPADRLLTVKYEELVSDQEPITRQIIDFCGLEWSDACLRPEKNQRAVKTPSVWQVRQPVYKTSMQRWRKFENCLGEFSQLLTDEERGESPCLSSSSS